MSDDTDATRRRFIAGTAATGIAALAGCLGAGGDGTETDEMTGEEGGMDETDTDADMMEPRSFTVRVENVSTGETLETSEGSKAVPLAPVAYALHEEDGALFTPGEAASDGLETLAEDGSPAGLVEELKSDDLEAGAAAVPEGAEDPAPIGPGGAYEFTVEAMPHHSLSLATMFVQSNDLFFAPDASGMALFDGDSPVEGDVTSELVLWDAGTEQNQEPGVGDDQAPRQSEGDTGADEGGTVQAIDDVDDGYSYPDVDAVVKVTVSTA